MSNDDEYVTKKVRDANLIKFKKVLINTEPKLAEQACYDHAQEYCRINNYSKELIGPTYNDKINDLLFNLNKESHFDEPVKEFSIEESKIKIKSKAKPKPKTNPKSNSKKESKFNNELLKLIRNKKYKAKDLVYMKPHELNPGLWSAIIKKKEFKEYKMKNMKTSDAFPCPRCKESKALVSQLQTRSSDEPMTTFVVCVVCSYVRKF